MLTPPRHFDNEGVGAEALPLDVLCGRARVLDLRGLGTTIDANTLAAAKLTDVTRVLLRTDSGEQAEKPFDRDYAHLTESAAWWICESKIRLLGIDSPSVEGFASPGMPVHRTLLTREHRVVIVEGLDLRKVIAGDYEFFCLPLKLVHGDGAPARAILLR